MDLRYPIGKPERPESVTPAMREGYVADIAAAPALLRAAIAGLNEEQLDTPYRPEGWTVRQVVHHMVDSHVNSYVRFRLALTESEPAIKPYDEKAWAELPDARTMPVEVSLCLLDCLHQRWVGLLRSMSDADFARTFVHPVLGVMRLDLTAAIYAWHGKHHAAHVTGLRKRMGWG